MNLLVFLMGLGLIFLPGENMLDCAPAGSRLVKSSNSFEETYQELKAVLLNETSVKNISEIDFSQAPEAKNTKLILFDMTEAATPIMQQNQMLGLDLPQKVLIFKTDTEEVYVLYNSIQYLRSRYKISKKKELRQMCDFLEMAVEKATGNKRYEQNKKDIYQPGIVTRTGGKDFKNIIHRLKEAISSNKSLELVMIVDHQKNALASGMGLRDSALFLIRDRSSEDLLLQKEVCFALDLPLKILVWQDEDGTVKLSYIRPEYLELRYNMTGSDEVFQQTSILMNQLVKAALSE